MTKFDKDVPLCEKLFEKVIPEVNKFDEEEAAATPEVTNSDEKATTPEVTGIDNEAVPKKLDLMSKIM